MPTATALLTASRRPDFEPAPTGEGPTAPEFRLAVEFFLNHLLCTGSTAPTAFDFADCTEKGMVIGQVKETSGAATFGVETVLSSLKGAGVQIPRPSEVREYLIARPGMADLALRTAGMARAKWDCRTQLSFEVFRDPDAFDQYLVLYVRQSDYSESIMEELEDVSEAIETQLSRCSGWLLVTTDFKAPR